jgi:ATP-dependent Lon protease
MSAEAMQLKSEPGEERAPQPIPEIPADALIILPVRETVLFPGVILPISVGRPRSIEAAQRAVKEQRQLGILMQRDVSVAEPAALDMHRTGVIANVVRYVTTPDGSHHLVCQGEQRFRVVEFLTGWPFMVARVAPLEEHDERTPEIDARYLNLQRMAVEALELLPQTPPELIATVQSAPTPGALADLVAAYLDIKPDEKQEVLETIDINSRVDRVTKFLGKRFGELPEGAVARVDAAGSAELEAWFDRALTASTLACVLGDG